MTLSATLLSHSTTRAQNRRTAVVSKNETRGGKEPEAAQAQAKGESSSPKAKKARTKAMRKCMAEPAEATTMRFGNAWFR